MSLKPVRKISFTPPAEMTGEAEGEVVTGMPNAGLPPVGDNPEVVLGISDAALAGHHPWIKYLGTETVHGPDDETALSPDAKLFVVTKEWGKLHPRQMTVAEMIAARGESDYPVEYRVA